MQNLKFALALSFITAPALAEVPALHVIERVQTTAALAAPVLISEPDGSKTLVQLEVAPGDKYDYLMRAYGTGGKIISEVKVTKPSIGQYLIVTDARRNQIGDVVAILTYTDQSQILGDLASVNLTTGAEATIGQGRFPSFLDRLRVGKQNLALVSTDLGDGPNSTYPALMRVVDEDNGNVISETLLNYGSDGRLGLNSSGQVRAIVFGGNLFGLIDVSTGVYSDLVVFGQKASQNATIEHLATGDFIGFNDGSTLKLLDRQALLDGQLKAVRTFSPSVIFVGHGKAPPYSLETTAAGLVVSDLEDGTPLSPPFPIDQKGNVRRTFSDVVVTPFGAIVVTVQPKNPDSFVPGTILNYININSGQVMRTVSVDMISLRAQVFVVDGQLIAIEESDGINSTYAYQAIDLMKNQVLSTSTDPLLVNIPFQSSQGQVMGLLANSQKQVCVVDLVSPQQRTCIDDQLLQADQIMYGYAPFSIDGNELVLPLVGQQSAKTGASPMLGYLEIEVN